MTDTAYDPIDYTGLPGGLQGGMLEYIEHGLPTGDFLGKFLSNDLFGSLGHADSTNRHHIWEIAQWIFNNAPGGCWGDKHRVARWIASGGLQGQAHQREIVEHLENDSKLQP